MAPKFEFAVVTELNHDVDQWFSLVRQSESLGYDALYVTDHTYQRLAAVPALAAASTLSDRIRLGTYVLNNDLRNAAVMARELMTVHKLSGNRAVLGLGAGWMAADYKDAALSLDSGELRYERLRSALRTIRNVFTDRTETHTTDNGTPPSPDRGDQTDQTEQTERSRYSSAAVPPLMLGGSRRKVLTLAGQEADIVSIVPRLSPGGPADRADFLPDKVDTQVAWVRAAAAGREKPPVLNHLLWACAVTDAPQTVLTAMAKNLGHQPEEVAEMVPFLIGTVDQVAQTLVTRRERWGFSLVTIPEAAAEQFAPVIPLLRGQ